MLIAHVSFPVSNENRSLAVKTLTQEVEAVRAMKGCIAFVPFWDAVHEGGVGVLHEWETAQDFSAYLASDRFAAVGQVLRPIMTSPPVSKRFDATLIENVN
ncbi:antibiotic biosynthesis monooxygenase [uncultured Litoreibacter sp.]|uniref:putative quinol monooxygenase n=1 Tax=uncultured Litoreibacter sp. TaxID=1392394 RepID=UPI0026315B61|nr:antibiotic biosynthesis monooxygenase [uncultured Litoreibacter sp.]